jgi:hypothetical protein
MTFWVVGGAIVGGAVIGAVGSNMAAGKSASAANNATASQAGMFNTITGQEQPFMTAGVGATNQLADLMGTSGNKSATGYGSLTAPFTAQDYLNNQDPGYQFQLQTGGQALRNADTPGVGSLSGAALKDLMTFNQNTAATGYQNAFNRYQTQNNNTYARLSGLAGLGQNAASNTGTAGTSLGTGMAQSTIAAGNATASGILGGTNAIAGGANSLAGMMYLNSGSTAAGAGTSSYVAGSPYGSGANIGDTYCDYALKCDVKRIGVDGISALPVYDFWYVDQDKSEDKWRGYMAQEVVDLYPAAVSVGPKGYLKVDYRQIPSQRSYPLRVPSDEDWIEAG